MNWWELAFSKTYADIFHRLFPEPTQEEVEQIMKWFPVASFPCVLDLACGDGRHSIALAKAGYDVTGVDLSTDFLTIAREHASACLHPPVFFQQDIRTLSLGRVFDLVMLIGNAFGYGSDKDQQDLLATAVTHLAPRGSFLLALSNGQKSIEHLETKGERIKTCTLDGDTVEIQETYTFDASTSVKSSLWMIKKNDKIIYKQETHVRFYAFEEVEHMLEHEGFFVRAVYNGFCDIPFTPKDPYMVIHAQKKKATSA
jgi:SAM-dependent methyltransferase